MYELRKQVEANPEVVSSLVEVGVTEQPAEGNFVPMEHLAYASRSMPALTLTVREPNRMATTRATKFSILDTELCVCKLSKLLVILNEAVAQTIASPDLQIDGLFFGSDGMKMSDKMYLKQVTRYLSANSRAPWHLERGSNVHRELLRIFGENLGKQAQTIGIKVLDQIFVRESDEAVTLRVHQKGTPLIETVIFLVVFAYLYIVYTATRSYFGPSDQQKGSKVKGT